MVIGKGYVAYWTLQDIIKQNPVAVKAFEKAHGPGYVAVFVFDNSSGHSVYAPDALLTSNMNEREP